MINVLKRLAELDANNPNVIKENTSVEECGPMSMMGDMEKPTTPATINITAGSGEELRGILGDIMKLAGVEKVTPDHLGVEHEPAVVTAEPTMAVGPAVGDRDDMRAVLDKMHDTGEDEEETDEGEYDNSPADAEPKKPFNSNEFANQENQPGQGDRMDGNMPKGYATMEQQLMADYKKFVAESSEAPADEGQGIDKSELDRILDSFERSMDSIGGYGDYDYNFVITALNQGDAESAAIEVCNNYLNQNGGELRHMNDYYKDLKDEFQWLVDDSKTANGVAEDEMDENMGKEDTLVYNVTFADGTHKRVRVRNAPISVTNEKIKTWLEKEYGKPVAKLVHDASPEGEPEPTVSHSDVQPPTNPYGHRRGADSDFL